MKSWAAIGAVLALCWGGSAVAEARPRLDEVKHWLLLLNNDLGEPVVTRIVSSNYDMVVVDHLASQRHVSEAAMADIVKKLKQREGAGPRLVIAYLNIGQAEDYRRYWKKGWRVGRPAVVLGEDPDGWQGNFPVAYWQDEWKSLIVGEGGILTSIRRAGFDGIYLDWVGGFEDENVIAAARRDDVDPASEMIKWVGEVSKAARSGDRPLYVIGQNASTLLKSDDYLSAIDAVAHEDIWFTGADSGPEGDCPVPRTPAEVGSPSFMSKLNAACLKSFRRDKANAMHFVGEAELVPRLTYAKERGKVIFTVDYALKAANIAEIQRLSRSNGFIPFAGARSLKNFVEVTMIQE